MRLREVHLLDLIRAHEGNPDHNDAHPSKIHWAKFNMIGKFIAGTVQAQEQCRQSPEYRFEENPAINNLVLTKCVMDLEVSSPVTTAISRLDVIKSIDAGRPYVRERPG
jgi:hypothetical protein